MLIGYTYLVYATWIEQITGHVDVECHSTYHVGVERHPPPCEISLRLLSERTQNKEITESNLLLLDWLLTDILMLGIQKDYGRGRRDDLIWIQITINNEKRGALVTARGVVLVSSTVGMQLVHENYSLLLCCDGTLLAGYCWNFHFNLQ